VKTRATIHSRTAAVLRWPVQEVDAKAMTRNNSARMKVSLIQKEMRRMRCSRYSVRVVLLRGFYGM
jgi:hypothetical protein